MSMPRAYSGVGANVEDLLHPGSSSFGEYNFQLLKALERPEHEDNLRDIAVQTMLLDLCNTDDYLRNKDPEEVIDAYNDILEIAPRIYNQKALVRVALRQYLESDGLDIPSLNVISGISKGISDQQQSRLAEQARQFQLDTQTSMDLQRRMEDQKLEREKEERQSKDRKELTKMQLDAQAKLSKDNNKASTSAQKALAKERSKSEKARLDWEKEKAKGATSQMQASQMSSMINNLISSNKELYEQLMTDPKTRPIIQKGMASGTPQSLAKVLDLLTLPQRTPTKHTDTDGADGIKRTLYNTGTVVANIGRRLHNILPEDKTERRFTYAPMEQPDKLLDKKRLNNLGRRVINSFKWGYNNVSRGSKWSLQPFTPKRTTVTYGPNQDSVLTTFKNEIEEHNKHEREMEEMKQRIESQSERWYNELHSTISRHQADGTLDATTAQSLLDNIGQTTILNRDAYNKNLVGINQAITDSKRQAREELQKAEQIRNWRSGIQSLVSRNQNYLSRAQEFTPPNTDLITDEATYDSQRNVIESAIQTQRKIDEARHATNAYLQQNRAYTSDLERFNFINRIDKAESVDTLSNIKKKIKSTVRKTLRNVTQQPH